MDRNSSRMRSTKRECGAGRAGLALARMFILLACAGLSTASIAATATDLDKLDAKIAKSAIPVGGFDKPKLPCVCEEGTTNDTLGAAGLLVQFPGVGRFIEGTLEKAITVACVVQGFDASGTLQTAHACNAFVVLPR